MVSIAMKPNPFKEKIAGVKLFEADSGEELSTLKQFIELSDRVGTELFY